MKLKDLLVDLLPNQQLEASFMGDLLIIGLALNSAKVQLGNLFIALAGFQQHGLVYVQQAIELGAIAVIYDPKDGGAELAAQLVNVPAIAVDDLATHLGTIAARYYDYPSQSIGVIGITGTNGKTSCSQFLGQMLEDCGVIGTLGWGQWGSLNKTINTTPDALEVQRILAKLREDKKQMVAMEVSSHGLVQGRVNAVSFIGAVFTNITRDHLDYHGTMEAYLAAKLLLLTKPGLRFVVVNLDDDYTEQVIKAVPKNVLIWGVSLKGLTFPGVEMVSVSSVLHKSTGLQFDVQWRDQSHTVEVPIYGDFNIENISTVLAVMLALEIDMVTAVKKLQSLQAVIGRMEHWGGDNQPQVFVDYAHTPDALKKVLLSLRKHCQQDLWVVFGCGGNRDKGKRSEMGQIAQELADHVIVTDDNPRFEDSSAIVSDILQGCNHLSTANTVVEVIQNREQAIKTVINNATELDCILIAGKGHEDYQEINGVRIPFSDSHVVKQALEMRVVPI